MSDEFSGDTLRVLLVEDNPGDARLLEEYLSEAGRLEAESDRVETLKAALDRLEPGSPRLDAVLLDLGLPDAEGLEAVKAVVEAAPELPVVVLTGRDDRRTAVEALREGAEDYLLKGEVGPDALARSVRYAVERKRAQRELEAERARLQEVFENAPAWVATLRGPEHVFEMANPAYYDLVGDRQVIGRPVREVFPELEGEGYFELLDHVYETGEPVEVEEREVRLETEDGTEVKYVTFVYQPRREDGEVTGIIAHGVDVTEQMESRVALEQAKELFQGVFDISPVALKIVDAETQEYRTVNEAFTEQFGYTREELEEGEVRDEDLWPEPEMRARIYDRVARGETVRNVEVRLRRKDGSAFDALFSASPLAGEGERFVVGAIQDITYQKEVERELKHRALHDDLTGLPNRALLDDRLGHALERCERTGDALAVCFVDLKRFKVINDSWGHEAGDRVLEQVADRVLDAVREQDTVARIGGDEFAVLLEDVEGEEDALTVADRVLRVFEEAVVLGDREVAVEASVGVAVHEGAGTERPAPTDLLRWADEAMYRAKEKPGTARALADPDHPTPDTTRIEREQRFRRALEAGEIETVYQPLVSARDGEIRGVEALSRWHDPELGQVSPGTFIPIAEETGLIVQLGEQQLEEGCRRLLAEGGPEGGEADRPLRLHVNLSSHQLEDPEVVGRVCGVLDRTGFPAGRLCLEVTESAAAREPEVLEELRELGVELALDDFGTRYSTLGQLKRLRVDALKIDRSFVDGLPEDDRDRAIVASVLTLGHALGLTVVAEGVETAEQWELLREMGADEAQGFHLARPMALGELREWMGESS